MSNELSGNTRYRIDLDPGPLPAAGRQDAGEGIERLDGTILKRMIWSAYVWLERHKETVNRLNVFPVPDGDTGTNMHLTMRAAWNEIDGSDETHIGRLTQAIAQGALMGARGNSGVILSQILRGIAHEFRLKPSIDGHDLVSGLQRGSDTAYKGVVKPVEGTILTVIRESAVAAKHAAAVDTELSFMWNRIVQAAGEAVERTPSLLPVLAKAGVVDSGGKGLFYILEGMLHGLLGRPVELAASTAAPAGGPPATISVDPFNLPPIRYGFDVQFLIWGTDLDVAAIRQRIIEIGDCPLVEGNATLVKVHVHSFDPSVPLAYGMSQGFITDVVVENMDAMAAAGLAPEDVQDALSMAPAADLPEVIDGVGIIAVAPGAGLRQVFESLGVSAVVSGGQTMNPSTKELLDAIATVPADHIILLPNNSNVIMAALQAQEMAGQMLDKRVEVVPSRTVPQGIAAVLHFNMQAGLAENAAGMTDSLSSIATGEVTVAVRDAGIDGVEVEAGQIIGLLNDVLTTTGATPAEAVMNLLAQMEAHGAEIITVYYGEPVTAAEANALADLIAEAYPEQDLEVVDGGQPFYHFIISAE